MPFVSSVRGSYGVQSRRRGQNGRLGAGANGGTITVAGGFRIHAFTATGTSTFSPDGPGNVEVLIVAGGGGGGSQVGGGGGAGGLIYSSSIAVLEQNYSVVVGAGGIGADKYPVNEQPGDYGQNSSAFGLTANRGGGGGCHPEGKRPPSGDDGIQGGNGRPGGSGGGGGGTNASRNAPGGSGTAGQGNNGGSGFVASPWSGGGGGGAGSAGSNAGSGSNGTSGATGGNGLQYSISGSAQFYAAGGGGCNSDSNLYTTTRASGVGGRGTGFSSDTSDNAFSEKHGVANTGSGGGGTRDGTRAGNGASGIVIIRYPI